MTFTSDRAKSLAKSRKRDEHGHFLKEKDVKVRVSLTQDLPIIPEFEKPLVSLSINNPFRKILYWLDQIRRKQTTTLAIRLTIPLIALPVVLFGAFQFGKTAGISFEKSQASPIPISSPAGPITLSRAGILKIAKSATQTRYLLSLKNGELVNLSIPPNIDLVKYQNKQILVTGSYSKNTGILTVGEIAEIEIYNTTVVPIPTPNQATPSAN